MDLEQKELSYKFLNENWQAQTLFFFLNIDD